MNSILFIIWNSNSSLSKIFFKIHPQMEIASSCTTFLQTPSVYSLNTALAPNINILKFVATHRDTTSPHYYTNWGNIFHFRPPHKKLSQILTITTLLRKKNDNKCDDHRHQLWWKRRDSVVLAFAATGEWIKWNIHYFSILTSRRWKKVAVIFSKIYIEILKSFTGWIRFYCDVDRKL